MQSKIYLDKLLWASWMLYAVALPLSMSATNIALGLACLFTVFYCWQNQKIFIFPSKAFIFLGVFFIWVGLNTWYVTGQNKGFAVAGKVWNMTPLFFLPFLNWDAKRKIGFVKTAACLGAVLVLLGLLQYFVPIHYFWQNWVGGGLIENQRFVGFQSHPLHTGALYSVLTLAAFGLSWQTKEKLWWFLSFILLLGVLLTASRSYYLGTTVGLFFILSRQNWKVFVLGLLLAVGFLFVLKNSSSYVGQRINSISPQKTDQSGQQRLFMWKAACRMIGDYPLTGIGYKQWRNRALFYLQKDPSWTLSDPAVFSHAHNSYLTIAAENGLVGLVLFLLFWMSLLRDFGRLKTSLPTASCAVILMLLVAAFFEHNLLTATVNLSAFWLLGLSWPRGENV